jgi:hypothetical protein
MAVTKITVSTAMRARDVSRPSEEHLTEAAGLEAPAAGQPQAPAAAPPPAPAAPPAGPRPGPAARAQPPSRRRRRRGR